MVSRRQKFIKGVIGALCFFQFSLPSGASPRCTFVLKELLIGEGRVRRLSDVEVWQGLMPALAQLNRKTPQGRAIENEIQAREAWLFEKIRNDGKKLPSFALRGIKLDSVDGNGPRSLNGVRENNYISESGGNFYLFSPELFETYNAEQIMGRLYSSISAVRQYAQSAQPLVILVKVDEKLPLEAGQGNDGIDENYPHTLYYGRFAILTRNIHVTNITRPSVPRRMRNRTGLIANGVPRENILAEIGVDNPPQFWNASDPKSTESLRQSDRWLYSQILKALKQYWH